MKKILCIILLCCLLCACELARPTSWEDRLPEGAMVQQDLKNGWIIFKLQDNLYLYHQDNCGTAGFEGLTQIH